MVITGAGERCSAPAAISSPTRKAIPFRVDPAEVDNPVVTLFRAIIALPVFPVIARVNGHALAGGFGLVCACDFAIVAEHAQLGTPEARIGMFPMMILPWMMRTNPRRKLLELCVTGEPITRRRGARRTASSITWCRPATRREGRRARRVDRC